MLKKNESFIHLFVKAAAYGAVFECYFSTELTMRENIILLYKMLKKDFPEIAMPDCTLCVYDVLTHQLIDTEMICRNLSLPQHIKIVIC